MATKLTVAQNNSIKCTVLQNAVDSLIKNCPDSGNWKIFDQSKHFTGCIIKDPCSKEIILISNHSIYPVIGYDYSKKAKALEIVLYHKNVTEDISLLQFWYPLINSTCDIEVRITNGSVIYTRVISTGMF